MPVCPQEMVPIVGYGRLRNLAMMENHWVREMGLSPEKERMCLRINAGVTGLSWRISSVISVATRFWSAVKTVACGCTASDAERRFARAARSTGPYPGNEQRRDISQTLRTAVIRPRFHHSLTQAPRRSPPPLKGQEAVRPRITVFGGRRAL